MNQMQRPWQEMKIPPDCIKHVFNTLIGTLFIHHQQGSPADVGMPPTWEKVVTYSSQPPDLAI